MNSKFPFPEDDPPKTFTCFHLLPNELQILIWQFSLPRPSRTIKIQLHERTEPDTEDPSMFLTSTSSPEPLLSMTRLSRDVIVHEYASIEQENLKFIIRFNPEVDIIYMSRLHPRLTYPILPGTKFYGLRRNIAHLDTRQINPFFSEVFQNIRRLAVDKQWGQTYISDEDEKSKHLLLAHFPNLQEFILVAHTSVLRPSGVYSGHSTAREVAVGYFDVELQELGEWKKSVAKTKSQLSFVDTAAEEWAWKVGMLMNGFRDTCGRDLDVGVSIMGAKIDLERGSVFSYHEEELDASVYGV